MNISVFTTPAPGECPALFDQTFGALSSVVFLGSFSRACSISTRCHPECGISGMLVLQCLCSHLDKYLDTAVFEQVSLDQPS